MILPEIPYYAVIFTSRKNAEADGYDEMADRMEKLGSSFPGFLGIQSARSEEGLGITVSYWKTLQDISKWKADTEHRQAQSQGRSDWYSGYEVRIAKIERQYSFKEI
ncbi:MAG: antibiotic biosynthesis monooxygenase [Bdellovibrio sp.]|nr:antibiotic biosynthesis monooxygenase [Bdellovibrio sp.]